MVDSRIAALLGPLVWPFPEDRSTMCVMAPSVAIAVLVVVILALAMRKVQHRREPARDYGLLREVATVSSQRSAGLVVDRLGAHGIHATTVPRREAGGFGILVFPEDEQPASRVLSESWTP
jgi:hypothetical protein